MAGKPTDDLLTEFRVEQRAMAKQRCTMGLALAQMEEKDRAAVQEALNDDSIYGSTIAKVLRNRGHDVRSLAVNRHRRKGCACGE